MSKPQLRNIILVSILLITIAGCALKTDDFSIRAGTDNLVYGSGTIIGVQIGMSESNVPIKATIGYEKYEFVSKPKADKASVNLETLDKIGLTGQIIERQQHTQITEYPISYSVKPVGK